MAFLALKDRNARPKEMCYIDHRSVRVPLCCSRSGSWLGSDMLLPRNSPHRHRSKRLLCMHEPLASSASSSPVKILCIYGEPNLNLFRAQCAAILLVFSATFGLLGHGGLLRCLSEWMQSAMLYTFRSNYPTSTLSSLAFVSSFRQGRHHISLRYGIVVRRSADVVSLWCRWTFGSFFYQHQLNNPNVLDESGLLCNLQSIIVGNFVAISGPCSKTLTSF